MENKMPVNIPGGIPSILDGAGAITDIVSEDTVKNVNDRIDEYQAETTIRGNSSNLANTAAIFQQRRTKQLVRDYKKIGRNDPCPCGSGKKYKKCCLESGEFETMHQVGE